MAEGPDTRRADAQRTDAARRNNPMNRLVPYLDLFMRLDDAELSRLAGVDAELVGSLRRQVVEIGDGLAQYLDLLPRLGDEELVRLTGASAKTVRFWRLCQPKHSTARAAEVASRAEISSITPMPRPIEAPSAAPRSPSGPEPRVRRPSGVAPQPTLGAGAGASQSQPIANWTHESSGTNAATMVTPPPHQIPASWDTSGPTAGAATMVTPIGQTPFDRTPIDGTPIAPASVGTPASIGAPTSNGDGGIGEGPSPEAMWGEAGDPSDTATLAAAGSQPRAASSSSSLSLDIHGAPFPGYEKWQAGRAAAVAEDDATFVLSDLDQ